MREMERRVEDTKIAAFEAPGMEENVYRTAWIFGTFRGYLWNMLLESNLILPQQIYPYNSRYVLINSNSNRQNLTLY